MNKEEAWLLNEKYHGIMSDAFSRDRERLAAGEPLAYVIGSIPFLNTTIYLDSRPLIPRPETEFWTEKAIADIQASGNPLPKILDLCAGSGCIGIAVLKALGVATADFVEINRNHHSLIRKNIEANGIDYSRVHIYGGDCFAEVIGTYDYILANPPYIDPQNDQSDKSVRAYEPLEALYGGKAGMDIIDHIIADAPAHLAPDGMLFIEHEPGHAARLQEAAHIAGFLSDAEKDQYGIIRYSVLRRRGF